MERSIPASRDCIVLGGYGSPVLLHVSLMKMQSHLLRTSLEQVRVKISLGQLSAIVVFKPIFQVMIIVLFLARHSK